MKNGFTMRQTLRGIQLFVATYEELSFTLAASRENTTQSGVSQHVGDIESSLGVKLFSRKLGAVKPTPAGSVYYAACIDILNAYEKATLAIKPYQEGIQGEIKVGLTPVMTRAVLAPAYARFIKENPNVTISIIDSYFGDLTDRVRSGELTFAIVPSAVGTKGLRTNLFAKSPEMLVSASKSPHKHCCSLRLSDIGPLDLAIPGPTNARRKMIESYLTSNGVVVRKFAELDSMLGCLDLISKGEWSAFLPLMMFKSSDFEDSVYTINLIDEPQLNLEMYLVQPARKILDEAATAFIRCLKEEFDRSEKLIRYINPIPRKKIKI